MILIDHQDDLFPIFHNFVNQAMEVIQESLSGVLITDIESQKVLKRWTCCHFTGEEVFEEISYKLGSISNVAEYIDLIMDVPMMDHLLCLSEVAVDGGSVILTLFMTLECFTLLCFENLVPDEEEISLPVKTTTEPPQSDKRVIQEQKEAELAWKKTFYEQYESKFLTMKNSTLINQQWYDHIVQSLCWLSNPDPAMEDINVGEARRFRRKYQLLTNVKNCCLYRKMRGTMKKVPIYEDVWDIMYYHHDKLSHTKDLRKNKTNIDLIWYKIPEACVDLFLKLCPYCFSSRNPTKKSKMNPLKFILSPRVGHRAQIDLISMESMSLLGFQYILRYVDHLSGFSHVDVLKTKSSEEVGMKLIRIFSCAIIPEILQSDNGSEFLGFCIRLIKQFYNDISLVKGKPRKPRSQGKIERGHYSFKENLQKWMKKNGKNWIIGAFVVNKEMNQIPQWNRGGFSPYNLYFGKNSHQRSTINFGEVASRNATTEYGILCAKSMCLNAQKKAPGRMVTEEELMTAMTLGDDLFHREENGDIRVENVLQEIKKIVQRLLIRFQFFTPILDDDSLDASVTIGEEESNDGCNDDAISNNDDKPNKKRHQSSYFKEQVRNLRRKYGGGVQEEEDSEDEQDNSSCDTDILEQKYNSNTHKDSKHRLCKRRAIMENVAAEYQKKQANQVNMTRQQLSKVPLENGDCGTIEVMGNTRAATDHRWLPIMVTSIRKLLDNSYLYKLCTQHGHLAGEFVPNDIYYNQHMNPKILKIDPTIKGFESDLTIAQASAMYNVMGGATFCKCKQNCIYSKSCGCMKLGKLCTKKCHGTRKDKKDVYCQNCVH
jgi:hypothetical protein